MKYRVGVIDCPWKFSDSLPGKARGAEKHYPCMSYDDLKNLEMPEFEDDSMLFMWRVASMQEEAVDLMRDYGFKLKSEIIWVKEKIVHKPINSEEDLAFGMGHYTRSAHEVCLIGTRGKAASKIIDNRSIRSVFFAPRLVHSQKPSKFYDIVEKMTGNKGPYIDIFARVKHRDGWSFIGNEIGSTLTAKK